MIVKTFYPHLPAAGRYIIDTVHDCYEVDVDRNTVTHTALGLEAAGHTARPDVSLYGEMFCHVGEVLTIVDWDPVSLDIRTRHTEIVLGITAVVTE